MPVKQNTFNLSLYELLKVRGYKPIPINSKGQTTPVPQEADIFKFDFVKNNKKYGEVWATIDNAQKLIVYYNDEVANSPSDNTSGTEFTDSWTGLLKNLKNWSQRKQLKFDLKNRDHLSNDMAQREYMKKENLHEGYMPMGKKASISDSIPTVKIILQHSRQLEENEKRYHNIAKIFVENTEGERFVVPTKRPGIAKVYARHVAEGGTPYDERGKHITSLVEEYTKIAGFVRATRAGTFSESAQKLVNEASNYYQQLRQTLSKMAGNKGYNAYFESWTPTLMETESDSNSVNELFLQANIDPRIENALPILSRLNKNLTEIKEAEEFSDWANDVIKLEGIDNLDYTPKKAYSENLDINQKRAGQLGPTEKVKNNNIGKLVGANESASKKDTSLNVGIEAHGVRGMKSKPWRKTFKSQEAFEKWLEKTSGDVEVLGTREVNLNDMFKESQDTSKDKFDQVSTKLEKLRKLKDLSKLKDELKPGQVKKK